MMKRISSLSVVAVLCMSAFFTAVHADGGEDVFEAVANAQESPVETKIDTSHYRAYAGYSSIGAGLTLYRDRHFSKSTLGYGLGISSEAGLAVSVDYRRPILPDLEHQFFWGAGITIGTLIFEPLALYAGYQYEKWLFELGYSIGGEYYDYDPSSNIFIRAGMVFDRVRERRSRDENRVRYFRPGIEVNYPVYRSDEFWDNDTPYRMGAGIFFRIGPEQFYFTTGAYAKLDLELEKTYTAEIPVSVMGITLGSIPIEYLTIENTQWHIEMPILLNYMLVKQVRLTAGALIDFRINIEDVSYYWVNIGMPREDWSDQNWQLIQRLERQLEKVFEYNTPIGNLYWTLGIDFDISRYWGLGVKYIIHNHSFGGTGNFEEIFAPSRHQLRASTYFVF